MIAAVVFEHGIGTLDHLEIEYFRFLFRSFGNVVLIFKGADEGVNFVNFLLRGVAWSDNFGNGVIYAVLLPYKSFNVLVPEFAFGLPVILHFGVLLIIKIHAL